MRADHSRPLGRVRVMARDLVVRDQPEPRIAQTLFLLLVLADLSLRTLGEVTIDEVLTDSPWPLLGLVLVLVAQVCAAFTPWARAPTWLLAALPVVDLAAVGLLRLSPDGGGAGILAVLPSIWLVWQYGLRGAFVAAGAGLAFLGVTGIAYFGLHGATLSRSVLDPVVAALVSGAVWALLTSVRLGQDEASRRSSQLATALEELNQARAFSNAIFESVDVGLVLVDSEGEYLAINDRLQDFLSLAFPDGHAGRAGQVGEIFAADGQRRLARHEMPSLRASRGEEYDDIRMWVGADPEARRALSVSARSVRDGGGELVGAALAYKDVTEFMRAMDLKDDFVATVSHEFRTPLTSISGYISLLLDEADRLEAEDVRYLEIVARNTERLKHLVTDLVTSAKVDARPMDVESAPAILTDLVSSAVDSARPAADAKQLTLTLTQPRHLTAVVDPQRFVQVVDNLVSNAVKYTPHGGRVEVRLAGFDDHVELTVSDTGVGIAPEERDRLFTRYFRTQDAESSEVPGVGLGLSISKKIVESHGGRIEVDSSDQGTTFLVWLPLVLDFDDASQDWEAVSRPMTAVADEPESVEVL